jgi:hypothetical protein
MCASCCGRGPRAWPVGGAAASGPRALEMLAMLDSYSVARSYEEQVRDMGSTLPVWSQTSDYVSLAILSHPHPRLLHAVMVTIATPTSTASASASGSSSVAVWLTLVAAIIAACVSGVSIYFVRKTGKATAKAAQDLADAAKKSAAATEESARAATRSADAASKSSAAAAAAVEVNARSADAAHRSADAALHSATSSERAAEIAAARAEEESLLSRYRSASEQLDYRYSATVRLAGVYAMAHLADDWPKQRQMCVDVLCAYLRMPLPADDAAAGEWQVRDSIVRLIDAHVTVVKRRRLPDEISWSGMSFDFSGGYFRDLKMEAPAFSDHVSFAGATFAGQCQLWAPTFDSEADFNNVTIEGRLALSRATLGSNLMASRFRILPEGVLSIGQTWASSRFAQILIDDSIVEGNFSLSVHPNEVKVHIGRLEAKPGSRVVVQSDSNDEGADARWFDAKDWMVHPKAMVWLPTEAAQLNMPWLKTSVARSGSVKFDDPPALD